MQPLKKLYTFNEFLKEFPTRDYFTDKIVGGVIDDKISKKLPIEFLPNNPIEGTFPSLRDPKIWEYSIAMFGIFPDGRRAIVMIDGIKPFIYLEKPKLKSGFYPGELPPNASFEDFEKISIASKTAFLNEVYAVVSPNDNTCEYSWEQGKPFYGWQAEESDYLKISFTKQSSRKKLIKILRDKNYIIMHDDRDDYYRVVARDYNMPLCSWVTLTSYKTDKQMQFKQLIYRVHVNDFKQYAFDVLANPILARDKSMLITWDEECSTITGELPTPNNLSDKLFMICATAHWWYQKSHLVKICFC
jgi:hypothetical protein